MRQGFFIILTMIFGINSHIGILSSAQAMTELLIESESEVMAQARRVVSECTLEEIEKRLKAIPEDKRVPLALSVETVLREPDVPMDSATPLLTATFGHNIDFPRIIALCNEQQYQSLVFSLALKSPPPWLVPSPEEMEHIGIGPAAPLYEICRQLFRSIENSADRQFIYAQGCRIHPGFGRFFDDGTICDVFWPEIERLISQQGIIKGTLSALDYLETCDEHLHFSLFMKLLTKPHPYAKACLNTWDKESRLPEIRQVFEQLRVFADTHGITSTLKTQKRIAYQNPLTSVAHSLSSFYTFANHFELVKELGIITQE